MPQLGKFLIFLRLILTSVGVVLLFNFKIPFFGKLPGDIYIKKENFVFYFPLTTSIIVSIVLSTIFYIISKFFK